MNAHSDSLVQAKFERLQALDFDDMALAQLDELERVYHATGLSDIPALTLAHWQPSTWRPWHTAKTAIARAAAAEVHKEVVDGQPLCYWECGRRNGPTLLLLHGFGSCKENWAFVSRLLGDQCHILAPDIFGFGDSHFRYGSNYSLKAQARRMLDWLAKRGQKQVIVVGNSMGGAIAAQMAAMDAERIAGVCLMNAAGAPSTRLSQLELSISQGENFLVPENFTASQRLFDTVMHRRQRLLGNAFSLVMSSDMCARAPVNHYLFGEMVKSLRPTWQCLDAVKAPTLILWGDSDQILDPSCIDAFHQRLPQAKTLVLPKVGHLPMLEAPRKTASMLKWLAMRSSQQEPAIPYSGQLQPA